MVDDFTAPAQARGVTCHLGKLDSLLKTNVDEVTEGLFLRKAADLDQKPAELLRDLVYLFIHDATFLELVAKHRRELVAQQRPFQDHYRTTP